MRLWHTAVLVSLGMLTMAGFAAADPTPVAGSEVVGAGMPTGPSPDKDKKEYSLDILYFDPTGKLAMTTITVPDIPVTAGLPNPTAAQVAAASAAKAAAIVKAINGANIAIQPVTIDGVTYKTLTAAINATTVPGGMYPTGKTMPQMVVVRGRVVTVQVPVLAPADFTNYTVSGVRQAIINPG